MLICQFNPLRKKMYNHQVSCVSDKFSKNQQQILKLNVIEVVSWNYTQSRSWSQTKISPVRSCFQTEYPYVLCMYKGDNQMALFWQAFFTKPKFLILKTKLSSCNLDHVELQYKTKNAFSESIFQFPNPKTDILKLRLHF